MLNAQLSPKGIVTRTMMDISEIPMTNDESSRQFEMEVEGRMVKLEYELNGTKMFLTCAKVPKSLADKGVGAELVERVFRHIEENKLKLVPMCGFVTDYLRKNPEWKRIVEKGVQV
ncbi:MAG TPA: GNAT family N-acetyltransferase [Flavobacteriales bacterium]|nr:GNAT family N-acetyltransferase [Flavobacteriales bacterium]